MLKVQCVLLVWFVLNIPLITSLRGLPSIQFHSTLRIKVPKYSPLKMNTNTVEAPTKEKMLFYSQKSFQDLGFTSKMVDVLKSLNIEKPSKIQALSCYGVNSGKPCIIADQTGSGKTLAYLVPVLERMLSSRKALKMSSSSNTVESSASVSPYVVIMTPTAELAM